MVSGFSSANRRVLATETVGKGKSKLAMSKICGNPMRAAMPVEGGDMTPPCTWPCCSAVSTS